MNPDSFENKLTKLAGRVSNIVLLGFFCTLCSLPIITFGASYTCLCKAMDEYLHHDNDKPLRIFFSAFKDYFVLATKVFLLHLVFIVVLIWDLAYYQTGEGMIDILGQVAIFVLLVTIIMEMSLVFTLIALDKEDKVFSAIRKGIDIVMYCPGRALGMLVCNIAIILATIFVFRGLILFVSGVICFVDYQFIPTMLEKYRWRKNSVQYQKEQRNRHD